MPDETTQTALVEAAPQNRIVDGRAKTWFKPGQAANPGGRPKGFGKRIRELTNDGEELIQHALAILRDKDATVKAQAEARQWLTQYAFGKPVETQDVNLTATITERIKELAPFMDATKRDELARYLSSIESQSGRS